MRSIRPAPISICLNTVIHTVVQCPYGHHRKMLHLHSMSYA